MILVSEMSDAEESPLNDEEYQAEEQKRLNAAKKRCYKYQDPPKVFNDIEGEACLRDLQQLVSSQISEQEIVYMAEISDYLSDKSGSWSIGDEHLTLLAGFLANKDNRYPPNVPLLTLQVLEAAALKDDFVLILHQDRKEHRIMSYINLMEQLTLNEQEEVIRLLCNLCGNHASFDWLMYISEWQDYDGSTTSNGRVATKAAVHALLNDQLDTLQDVGVSFIFNLSLKNVFDDVASEVSTAILQYLHNELSDDRARLCLIALTRFMEINPTDIGPLTRMLGPDLSKFKDNRPADIAEMAEKLLSKLPKIN